MKMIRQYKPKILADSVLVITCLFAVLVLAGCEQEGPAEKTGEKIDQAAESTKQTIEQTTEKAGQQMEAAKESVTEKAETAGTYLDDSVITMKVKTAIFNDPSLKASQIEVTTVDGVVKLSGTVDSEQSIDKAVELAKSQENVKSVQTDLTVNVNTPTE